jgi:flagellar protein FliL
MASKPKKSEVDAADDGNEGEAGAPRKAGLLAKLPLKMIIIGVAAVAVLGGGFGAYKMFFSSHKEEADHAKAPEPAVFVDMPDVLVNLANAGADRTQYLKVKITLEVPDQMLAKQITPVMPRVMDAFQTYLRELRPTDLDGSAGLYRMKEELTRRVNVAIAPSRINAVLFKEIVVQ